MALISWQFSGLISVQLHCPLYLLGVIFLSYDKNSSLLMDQAWVKDKLLTVKLSLTKYSKLKIWFDSLHIDVW